MHKASFVSVLVLAFVLSLVGCKGSEGPAGAAGPQGNQGDPGPGTRNVYTGVATSDLYEVSVPEVDLGDMPNVGVYVRFAGMAAGRVGDKPRTMQGGWMALPYSWTDGTSIWFHYAYFVSGKVILEFVDGMEYRIVVVE